MLKSCLMSDGQIQAHKEISLNLIKMLKMSLCFKYLQFHFLQSSVHKNKYTETNPINHLHQ